jgi:DNA-binding response OmpR family regulator
MPESQNNLVLVADDEPSTRELVSNHLRNRGYEVVEASDGDEAWSLAEEHLPNLVILDVMMPGMSGWEVCRRIREAVSLAHTGVIMLTGIGEHLNAMTSPLYGADAYVDKPFDFRDLDQKVAESLASRSRGILGRPDGADVEPPSGPSPDSVDYLADLRAPPAPSLELPARPAKRRTAQRKARKAADKKPAKRAKSRPKKPARVRKPAKSPKRKAAPRGKARAAKPAKGKPVARKARAVKPAKGKPGARPAASRAKAKSGGVRRRGNKGR